MVNIEQLRQKYNEINKVGSGENPDFLNKFLRVDEGATLVRIMPSKNEELDFYAETAIHRIDEKNYHCPKVQGNPCPLCDLSFKLWNTKEPGNQDIARQIKARKRFYLNVLDRESTEVKILSLGIKLFTKILDCFFDEDYGDITHLETGHDFKIIRDNQGQWPNYDKSAPRPKSTPAGSPAEDALSMDEIHSIHELVKPAEYEELKKLAMGITGEGGSTNTDTSSEDSEEDYLSHLKGLN